MSDGNAHNNYNVRVVVGRDRRSRGIATSVIARVRLANLSLSLMATVWRAGRELRQQHQ